MTYTTNYQLNQWAKSDRVMMDDFNADNTKIDAALKANADTAAANTQTLAAQAQAIAKLGNGAVAFGTYTGNGKSGSSYPNTLNFPHKPVLVVVRPRTETSDSGQLLLLRNTTWSDGYSGSSSKVHVTWNANSVKWYAQNNTMLQMSFDGREYCYAALLAVE